MGYSEKNQSNKNYDKLVIRVEKSEKIE